MQIIEKEVFCLAIDSMREQIAKDKLNSSLIQEVFPINEEFMYDNSLLIKQIINLLSIWFDKEDLEHYCFEMNFGKPSYDSNWETTEMLYDRLAKN
jgi:hypothetical protein